jgi:hypothetical protein
MVWHAFVLNPRNYLEDCVRFGLPDLWATGIPWPAVNAAIDTRFNYTIPEQGKDTFIASTGHKWDNSKDSLDKTLQCCRCTQELVVPWTTIGSDSKIKPGLVPRAIYHRPLLIIKPVALPNWMAVGMEIEAL